MALSTFTELKASIDDWLARSDLTGVADDLVLLAEREIRNNLRAKEMVTRFQFQITTQFSQLPTDFITAKEFKILKSAKGTLNFVAAQKLDDEQRRGVSNTPCLFTIRGTELQVGQIPAITEAQTISTLTRVGTTVTMTTALAHGLKTGGSITVSGAVETAYNGTFDITSSASDTVVTYEADSTPSASPATGTPVYIVNNAELTYWAFPTALSVSNATNTILDNYPDIYLFGALKNAVSYTQNAEQLSVFGQRFIDSVDQANTVSQIGEFSGSVLQMRFS